MTGQLSPLQAYDLAEAQKRRQARDHFATLVGCYEAAADDAFTAAVDRKRAHGLPLADAIRRAYREMAVADGLHRIDPKTGCFDADLGRFFANYATNFRLASERESLAGFRALLSASPRADGYEERAYSLICPITGRYLMGFDFTVQPDSDSAHLVYAFVMPWARGGWGFGAALVEQARRIAGAAIAAHFATRREQAPHYYDPDGPVVLFEKNRLEAMTLSDVLMDAAGIEVHDPPDASADLSRSGMPPSLRDCVWHRLGGRMIDYRYIQSSLDGVIRVPMAHRARVIRLLNGIAAGAADADAILAAARGHRAAGCTTLDLCVFAPPDRTTIPAAQIRRSNEIFQAISVLKDPAVIEDIYFQAQVASLESNSREGSLRLLPITPADEDLTRRLLAAVTWLELQPLSGMAPEKAQGPVPAPASCGPHAPIFKSGSCRPRSPPAPGGPVPARPAAPSS